MPRNTTLAMLVAGSLVGVVGCATTGISVQPRTSMWTLDEPQLNPSAAQLENNVATHIAWAMAYRTRIAEVEGPRTVGNTLTLYNQMMMHLRAAASECELFANVHPSARVRDTAERGEQEVSKVITELSLDRDLYEAFRAIDTIACKEPTKFLIDKTLREFRRNGVDEEEPVRRRVAVLKDEILKLGQTFTRNTDQDTREILLDSPAALEGMPRDWIAAHQPGADGKIHVSTRYPDYIPFMTYAHAGEARRELYGKFKNRGYPQNITVLSDLIAKRHELATLLGFSSWADYITEDKMIATSANVESFLERIHEAGRSAAQREYDTLLARKRETVPTADSVEDWEKGYYEERVRAEQYAFEAQALRPYFNLPDVQRGIFDLTSKLFGITYKEVKGLTLWHPDVSAWDVFEGKKCLGRFYLDLYPRENKYGHAAQFDIRIGIAGQRLPQAALVCNFPDPASSADGSALMEHEQVVTFFHEFGHLLHAMFSGHNRWMGNSGITVEWDFVEAPSQMLEEWCYDPQALTYFAKHHQTGEPIPTELVSKLRRAKDFGKALANAHQVFYSAVSLNYYNRDPATFDTTKLMAELQERFSPFAYVDDTHFQCSFRHLNNYSAIYYTYRWSLVIAKDMFSRFEREGILNPKTAKRYRKLILERGGSRRAADMVSDFLGRSFSFEAFEDWLNRT